MDRTRNFIKTSEFASSNETQLKSFYRFDAAAYDHRLRKDNSSVWERAGARKAIRLFRAAAERIPAYKHFLKKHRIRPGAISAAADFAAVPPTTKENYIDPYPLAARCWDGAIGKQSLVAISSGTSGQPRFWPRSSTQESEAGMLHELLYRKLFEIHKRKTLLVVGFPMGMYVSGVAETLASWLVSTKGYDLTLVTIGNHRADVLRAVDALSGDYDQVILEGHPFFIKDVVETAQSQGKKLRRKQQLHLLFCSEGYSEGWRDFVIAAARRTGGSVSAYNTYGSSEMLLMGYETPLTIALRKEAMKSKALRRELGWESQLLPHLFQYNPVERYIEQSGDELLFTANSGIPLVRFNLHDSGSVFSYADGMESVRRARIPKLASGTDWRLPFIALRGRSDQTLVFYAANIYPEHVHSALNHKRFLPHITGKFTMKKEYTPTMDQVMEVHIELKPGVRLSKKARAEMEQHLYRTLQEVNMEYAFLDKYLEKDIRPKLVAWPYQHETYFKPGIKPKFIIHTN